MDTIHFIWPNHTDQMTVFLDGRSLLAGPDYSIRVMDKRFTLLDVQGGLLLNQEGKLRLRFTSKEPHSYDSELLFTVTRGRVWVEPIEDTRVT